MKTLQTVAFVIIVLILLVPMIIWKLADWASDGWVAATLDKIWLQMRPTMTSPSDDTLKTFKIMPYQKALMEAIANGKKIDLSGYHRNIGKSKMNDEITSQRLASMKEGDKFGLATPEGLRIFTLMEVRKWG